MGEPDALPGHVQTLGWDRVERGQGDSMLVRGGEVVDVGRVLKGDVPGVEAESDRPAWSPPPVVVHPVEALEVLPASGVVLVLAAWHAAIVWARAGLAGRCPSGSERPLQRRVLLAGRATARLIAGTPRRAGQPAGIGRPVPPIGPRARARLRARGLQCPAGG